MQLNMYILSTQFNKCIYTNKHHHNQNVEEQEYNRKGLSAPLGSV